MIYNLKPSSATEAGAWSWRWAPKERLTACFRLWGMATNALITKH